MFFLSEITKKITQSIDFFVSFVDLGTKTRPFYSGLKSDIKARRFLFNIAHDSPDDEEVKLRLSPALIMTAPSIRF